MNTLKNGLLAGVFAIGCVSAANAQVNASDSVMNHVKGNRLSVGGYGEVVYSRMFYSDSYYRYQDAPGHKNDKSNGRFDIPHAVVYLGYDFGKGWTMGTEIEFEHTGTGSAIEVENDEGGEYEHEIEKGGEVEIEQFWLNKRFADWANVKLGHIIVPVGLNNAHHEPLNFFTVYRPEGENTVLPSTWHDTGISLWGRYGDFKYEVMMVAGLNAMMFSRDGWVHGGAGSAYEFKPANKYGFAFRVDNYTLPGLRLGLSGYYGQSMHNTYPNDMVNGPYRTVKANTYIGSFDFTFNRYNWIVRGQADYGYISDTPMLNSAKRNSIKTSPYNKTQVGKNAVAIGIEAGYNVFSQISCMRAANKKLYLFGRYDYYDSYINEASQPESTHNYTNRRVFTVGANYYPLPQIAVKCDYSYRKLRSPLNNEPSLNIGIAYEGFFL